MAIRLDVMNAFSRRIDWRDLTEEETIQALRWYAHGWSDAEKADTGETIDAVTQVHGISAPEAMQRANGLKWTPEHRAKYEATMRARKQADAMMSQRRKGKKGRK